MFAKGQEQETEQIREQMDVAADEMEGMVSGEEPPETRPKLQAVPAVGPGAEEEEPEITPGLIAKNLMIRYGEIAVALADRLAKKATVSGRPVSRASMMGAATRIMLTEQISITSGPQGELAFLQLQAIRQQATGPGLVVPAGTVPVVADPR